MTRRWPTRIVILATIAGCGYFLSLAVGALLISQVSGPAPIERSITAPAEQSSQRLSGLDRIFPAAQPSSMIHSSTLALTLLATVVAKQPEQSMAVLRGGGRTMIVRTQTRLRPGLVVEAVHTSSVVLRHERGLEQLGFKTKRAVSPEAASSRSRRQGFQGVRQTGATRYEIQRSALRSWLSNPAKLARCGRVVPLASGLRLLGIRPRCLWSQLGLRSGDRLVAVNHRAITSPEVALELYTRLRNARFVQLDLLRKGQKISLDYAIR